MPEVDSAAGFAPLSVASYSQMEEASAEAIRLAASPNVDAAATERIRAGLGKALTINPSDPNALRAAATIYGHLKQYATASGFANTLVEVSPDDGNAWAVLGQIELLGSHFENADKALARAIAI